MKYIILNHKMNLYYEELYDYIKEINKIDKPLIIAPSSIYLLEFLKNTHHKISSQDICYIDEGNYTGKVSWKQVKHLGIKYSLIGHSEKHDDIDKINEKIKVCLENEIIPIVCFGNIKKEDNIINILSKINIVDINNIIFAYEPTFNISNDNIDINYIKDQIDIIYNYLLNTYHKEPNIVYGGGIKEDNINEIYNIDKLKGVLIGSISSDIKKITELLLKINEK